MCAVPEVKVVFAVNVVGLAVNTVVEITVVPDLINTKILCLVASYPEGAPQLIVAWLELRADAEKLTVPAVFGCVA